MDAKNNQVSRRVLSLGHGHGIRASIASAIRRKGLALVSLSGLLREPRSSHYGSTRSQPWSTDPGEESPSACHLENIKSPPYGSWSAGRNRTSKDRKRQFWTVSGARSRPRVEPHNDSAESEHQPRMSKARSFVQSLRRRTSAFHAESTFDKEISFVSWDDSNESSEESAPTLAMPLDCADETEHRSAFWLGIQKAVQDTVDENFTLRSTCETAREASISGTEVHGIPDLVSNSPRSSLDRPPYHFSTIRNAWPSMSLTSLSEPERVREPGNIILDYSYNDKHAAIPLSPGCSYDAAKGSCSQTEIQKPSNHTGVLDLLQAFEHLRADLQGRKEPDRQQQLDPRDQRRRNLKFAIKCLVETLSSGGNIRTAEQINGYEHQELVVDEGLGRDQEQESILNASSSHKVNTYSIGCEESLGLSEASDDTSIPDNMKPESFKRHSRFDSSISSFSSLNIPPPPPVSPNTTSGSASPILQDEKLWEMQCAKFIMELLMKDYFLEMNTDMWEQESMMTANRPDSTRLSLQDELLQVGESFDGDGDVDDCDYEGDGEDERLDGGVLSIGTCRQDETGWNQGPLNEDAADEDRAVVE